jgi:hypothetical protein
MGQRPERADPQPQAGDLRRRQVHDHHLGRVERQHRERVVPRRADRHQRSAGHVAQGLGQDIGILPELGVTDMVEGGLRGDLGAMHRCAPQGRSRHRPTASRHPRSSFVAPFRPTTQGMPSSRATMAEWDRSEPRSTTMAEALEKTAIQPGSVWRATRISPGLRASVRGSRITRARAVTRPAEQPVPCREVAVSRSVTGSVQTGAMAGPRRSIRSGGSGRSAEASCSALRSADEGSQVARQAVALDRAEDLVLGEEEDVTRCGQKTPRGEFPPEREEHAARVAEDARAFEAQVFAVADAGLGPVDERLRDTPRTGALGNSALQSGSFALCSATCPRAALAAMACSRLLGSSPSGMLSSFSSSVQRSPNRSR